MPIPYDSLTKTALMGAFMALKRAEDTDSVTAMIGHLDRALSFIGKALLVTTEPEYANTDNYDVIHKLRERQR